MKIKRVDGSWNVEVLLTGTRSDLGDNILVRIEEECPPVNQHLKSGPVTIGITAADARELARRLVEVAAEDEAASRRDVLGWDDPPRPAPKTRESVKSSALFTLTQGRYLAFIHRYQTKNYGRSPAESDIQRHMLVSGPSVHQMIVTLERRGLIVRTPGQARSIQLLVPPDVLPDW